MATSTKHRTIQEAFEAYHAANPEVYAWLCRQARRAKERGYKQVGIKLLVETWRWHVMMEVADPSQQTFRISNDYTSRYARLIMEREPDLDGFFETRELRSLGPSPMYTAPEATESLFVQAPVDW